MIYNITKFAMYLFELDKTTHIGIRGIFTFYSTMEFYFLNWAKKFEV